MRQNEERISEEIRGSLHKQLFANSIMFAALIAYGINLQQNQAVASPVTEPTPKKVDETPRYEETQKNDETFRYRDRISDNETLRYRDRISDNKPAQPSGDHSGFPGGKLWKFSSGNWTGYIDIRTDGLYYTHWGYGHWTKQDDGSYLLQNDHDGFSHTLRKKNDSIMVGQRVDGVWERCDLIYDYAAKQKQPYDPRFMPKSNYSTKAFDE